MINPEIREWMDQTENPLELSDVVGLADFEEAAAEKILPEMNPDNYEVWMSRAALKDLIRPPTFFGTIKHISITELDNPYERLLDAIQSGLRINKPDVRLNPKISKEATERSLSFRLNSITTNGMNLTPGSIETQAWYIPSEPFGTGVHGFPPIKRFIVSEIVSEDTDTKEIKKPNYRGLDPSRYGIPGHSKHAGLRIGRS